MRPSNRSELHLMPQDKLLYDEIVYDKVNGKLKKLRVKIKQSSTSDGSKDDGEEAKCIKVPLLQKGNKSTASALRKLQYTINTFIAPQEDLKHWWLRVSSSGNLQPDEYVYLCITKYAVIIMQRFQILEHHSLTNSDISCKTSPTEEEIQLILSKRMGAGSSEGFTLLSKYSFKTADWESIENAIKVVHHQQLSATIQECPPPHFNIVHSEISASGCHVPGTTSDNIVFMPSYHENNNTSSSGSTSYIPSTSSNKVTNVGVHTDGPSPHFVPNDSSSSNGHIPNMRKDRNEEEVIHFRHSDVVRPKNIPLLPELLESPRRHYPEKIGMGTDPSPKVPEKQFQRPASADCYDNSSFASDDMDEGRESAAGFATVLETEEDNLPPPTPCTSLSHPHGEIFLKDPPPCLPDPIEPTIPPKHRLLRSQSFYQLTETELLGHDYVNLEYSHLLRRNVHDDSPYLRFYYNFGFVRMASIGKKISRRQRFSKELPAVDFNKLENHEQWYDQEYKYREKDLRFCRLSRMNIQKEEENLNLIYSVPKTETAPDDPYWSSSLSLTIQKMLQEHPKDPKMSDEIQSAFDLSHEQLVTIQVLLSLVPSEKNWRDLAEYIGLDSNDISIIEHYCYTYRELAARVVLYHWLLSSRKTGQADKQSSWESLHDFVDEIQRNDIKNVMDTERQNENIQKQADLQNMWRGERSSEKSSERSSKRSSETRSKRLSERSSERSIVRGELTSTDSRPEQEVEENVEVLIVELDEVTYL